MTKLLRIFKASFLPLVMLATMISLVADEWEKTIFFLVIYTVSLTGDRLKDMKDSIDRVYFILYKNGDWRNE
ncbi:hypothetical protein IW492_05820 [Enterococcus sp. BWB1-3]|uniref:hypothetical protein n=1 Tax=Enterococcus sp. BWB1-3 TaxID=2787713 RepID=UPI0019240C75|nr:hypothetical protein [Enterococcus sp. BWB1-3]MBL1228749.1 hypothetical protein [Enterococcus sp. BWB1-3]